MSHTFASRLKSSSLIFSQTKCTCNRKLKYDARLICQIEVKQNNVVNPDIAILKSIKHFWDFFLSKHNESTDFGHRIGVLVPSKTYGPPKLTLTA